MYNCIILALLFVQIASFIISPKQPVQNKKTKKQKTLSRKQVVEGKER